MTTNLTKSFGIRDNIKFYQENIHILTSASDVSPLDESLVAPKGSLVIWLNPNGNAELWIKTGDQNTDWISFLTNPI